MSGYNIVSTTIQDEETVWELVQYHNKQTFVSVSYCVFPCPQLMVGLALTLNCQALKRRHRGVECTLATAARDWGRVTTVIQLE